jgi:GH15 family glucan-1,4-alpha-glucosidase
MIPLVGFLPATDPHMLGTVEAIRQHLTSDGLVARYQPRRSWTAYPRAKEIFWPEARALFARLLEIRNDVGLLSEQYDADQRRLVGNFPQAFSRVGLINTARNLSRRGGPAEDRTKG